MPPELSMALLGALRPRRDEAVAVACALAPEGPGPGVRYHVYGPSPSAPAKTLRFQAAFPDPDAWFGRIADGDPGSLELALEVLSRLAPDDVVPIARDWLALPPWNMAWYGLGRALARVPSADAFTLLLRHGLDHTGMALGVGASVFPSGADAARARLDGLGDVLGASVEPRARLLAEGLIRYLFAHGGDDGRALAARVFREARSELVYAGGHALFGARDYDVLAEAIDDPRRAARWFATRAILARDPAAAIDALGGLDALRTSPRAALLLDVVASDADDAARGDSHGWLAADPRFARLAVDLARDPVAKGASAGVLRHVPADVVKALKRNAPKPKRPRADPAVAARAARVAARIRRLVAWLQADGYRFVGAPLSPPSPATRRLIRALEAEVGPLPTALKALWTELGGVDLRGSHPRWSKPGHLDHATGEDVWTADPLVLLPPDPDALEDCVAGSLPALPVAPDDVGKAGWSGGLLTIALPSDAADPPLEGTGATLLGHLERALAHGGFPGLAAAEPAWLASAIDAASDTPTGGP